MSKIFKFTISDKDAGQRLDKFLISKLPEFSRAKIQKLIETANITVDEKPSAKKKLLKKNQVLEIKINEPTSTEVIPQNLPLEIIFEDEDLMVINKAKGIVVHPSPGHQNNTLVNALIFHSGDSLSSINGILRPGILHRLDKDTSGVLLVAKNNTAHNFLAEQIQNHSFKREYEALVHGVLKDNGATISTQIGRHKIDRKKMTVLNFGGKKAVTHYKVIKKYEKYTHVKLILETGRTHQIRVHMAYIGHPIAGDETYSRRKNEFKRLKGQCLHAKTLGFIHPKTRQYMEFTSDLPKYFQEVLSSLF